MVVNESIQMSDSDVVDTVASGLPLLASVPHTIIAVVASCIVVVVSAAIMYLMGTHSGQRKFRSWNLMNELHIIRSMAPLVTALGFKRNVPIQALKKGSIVDLFERNAKRWPNKDCIVCGDRTYSFAEVDRESNRMARWLLEQGAKPKDVIAMMMENSAEFIFTWLAINKIGAVAAFINYNLREKSLLHCLKIANSSFLIFHDKFADALKEIHTELHDATKTEFKYFAIDTGSAPATDAAVDASEETSFHFKTIDMQLSFAAFDGKALPAAVRRSANIDDPAILIYTSGTTGMPKAAVITHARHMLGGNIFACTFHVRSDDRIYNCLPLYHSAAAIIGMGTVFRTGATIIISRKFSASRFWEECFASRATVIQYIGEIARYLLNVPEPEEGSAKWNAEKTHCVRLAIGNGMRPDVWGRFKKRFAVREVGEFYASTEGNVQLANWNTGEEGMGAIGRTGPILRQIQGMKIVRFDYETEAPIRGPNGLCIECKPGEPGELIGPIRGWDPTKDFKGYHGNKEATQKKILQDVFRKDVTAYVRSSSWNVKYEPTQVDTSSRWKTSKCQSDARCKRRERLLTHSETDRARVTPGSAPVTCLPSTIWVTGGSTTESETPSFLRQAPIRPLTNLFPSHYLDIICFFIPQQSIFIPPLAISLSHHAGWKGENVATTEVAQPIAAYPHVKEANVYGAEVPGKDGRAGMAAIVTDPGFDIEGLAPYLRSKLPKYAVPLFIRLQPEMAITTTFKHQKVELRKQGMDPSKVTDPLYFLDPATNKYSSFGAAEYQGIVDGKIKI
ncbi:Fatty-acid-CoA ligase FadD6 [Quaeritorhiza haematococci]|nr:Fatty-acid-CoA ligase FadD6 [Quaeritorhiza haematococci]